MTNVIHYESNKTLRIKAKSGFEDAKVELEWRKRNKFAIGLMGINDEKLVYIIGQGLDTQLQTINILYQNFKVTDKAYHDNVIIDSYHSATIEGARTTVDNVKRAIESKKGTKDDRMVVNSVNGFYYALNNPLTINNLLELWKIVVDGVCENTEQAGPRFRKGMVYIGDNTKRVHTPEKPEKIEDRMADLYDFMKNSKLDVMLKAAIIHFYFAYIHPFCDGNGRSARILMSAYLEKNKYSKIKAVPISRVINENLSGYYKSLLESEEVEEYNNGKVLDITPFIVYILNVMEQALISAIAAQNALNDIESLLITKMKKNKGAEITIETCSKIFKIDEREAANILNGLVDKGYLEKRRSERNYYRLIV